MKKLILITSFVITLSSFAFDADQIVSGQDIDDQISKMEATSDSPFVINSTNGNSIGEKTNVSAEDDHIFPTRQKDLNINQTVKDKLTGFGYDLPDSTSKNQNYIELDKKVLSRDYRENTKNIFNIAYFKNNFDYSSSNNVINRTITESYRHVKGGHLLMRNDTYLFKTVALNSFWSIGGGIGFNSGRGYFVNGDQSSTTFKLWEVPIDAGVGLEIPLYHWFSISGVGGVSAMGLLQSRDDFLDGEKGNRKIQVSYGQFLELQFKVNFTGLSSELAHEMFMESGITNFSMNIESRFHNYQNFQDPIKLSGLSFGIGFSFGYL